MPSSGVFSALGAFLQSAGAAAPRIAQDYNDQWERQDERTRKRKAEDDIKAARASGGKKISAAMKSILNPMPPEEAKAHLANTPPKEIQKAEKMINDAGVSVGVTAPFPRQAQRWEENRVKNAMRKAIKDQESGNKVIKEHPTAANGLTAYGKFGIVPELHIDKVGLDPKKPEDIKKWKADEALQEQTFDLIIDKNYKDSGGNVDKALERYYGVAKDKSRKQRLADGREMPSVNEYVAQVKSKMGDAAQSEGMLRTAGKARSAIDALVSEDFSPPSRAKMDRQEDALGKLYAEMTPDEIEQNKGYLDRITQLASTGREEYRDEVQTYSNNLNRQTTAAINAMKLDEQMQMALLKARSGTRSLSNEEVRALEGRRKLLDSMYKQLTDFTVSVRSAKPAARESVLLSRPDLTTKEKPGIVGRVFGAKEKTVINDAKILQKMDFLQEQLMEVDRALAGLGGLDMGTEQDFQEDLTTMRTGPARGGNLTPYLRPIKK